MSAPKFTPWRLEGSCDVVDSRGCHVAGCYWALDKEECDAQRSLIAAAPDLFEALRYIVECVDAGNEPLAFTVVDQARSALSKAGGA